MRIGITWFAFAMLAVAWSSWPESASAQVGPRQTIETADRRVRELLASDVTQGSPEAARRDEQLRAVVDGLLDLDSMAQEAIGQFGQRANEEQRREYRALLGQLVERAYLHLARQRVAYQLQYGTLSVDRDRAWVETLVVVSSEARDPTYRVVFVMARHGGRWRVRELITDGVHLVGAYRVQFTRLIRHRGFKSFFDECVRAFRTPNRELIT